MTVLDGGTKRIDFGITGADTVDLCLLEGVMLTNVNQAFMEGNLLLG